MTLADSITRVVRRLGQGDTTPAEERRCRIELQAMLDYYEGNPYDDSRWNITEAYTYREGWRRAVDEASLWGKGVLAKEVTHADRS